METAKPPRCAPAASDPEKLFQKRQQLSGHRKTLTEAISCRVSYKEMHCFDSPRRSTKERWGRSTCHQGSKVAVDWRRVNQSCPLQKMRTKSLGSAQSDDSYGDDTILVYHLHHARVDVSKVEPKTRRELLCECRDEINKILNNLATEERQPLILNGKIQHLSNQLGLIKSCTTHQLLEFGILTEENATYDFPESKLRDSSASSPKHSQSSKKRLPKRELNSICIPSLKGLGTWNFDIYALEQETNGQPLASLLSYIYMNHIGLQLYLDVDQNAWTNFFQSIERQYRPKSEVPYHNSLHAAQTTAVMYWFSTTGICTELTELSFLAVIMAAAIHDVGHFGRTNEFLVQTGHKLAVLYNDTHVLENFHVATAYKVLKHAELNILKNLSREDQKEIRHMVIAMVLGTDMAMHSFHCEELTKHIGEHTYNKEFKEEIWVSLMHASDISGAALEWKLAHQLAQAIIEEFREEGDELRELGMEILPLFDRHSESNLASSQLAFINYAVKPLFELLLYWVPELQEGLDILNENEENWNIILENPEATSEELAELIRTCHATAHLRRNSAEDSMLIKHKSDPRMYLHH